MLRAGMRVLDNEYKLRQNIKIAMLYLEDDDAVSAEMFIKKAATLVAASKVRHAGSRLCLYPSLAYCSREGRLDATQYCTNCSWLPVPLAGILGRIIQQMTAACGWSSVHGLHVFSTPTSWVI
jgi:hypothetical protein